MNYRKFGKYVCALGLAAAMSVTTMGATISDVASNHWAYPAVTDLEQRGIMVLTSSGQFLPNQTMNYFEVADVIAKATGYVDVDIVTNIDANFKQQIKSNYEKQKAILDTYASKYSTWNSAYNQQIAYLLGRGYMNTSDLDKFITKASNGETKNIVTKEQLAVYIVRMLEKEVTAKNTYQKTTFSDDSKLTAAYKPYVEYLRSVGLINPDTAGNANGTMKVTKALCAKMVSESLKIKDTTKVGKTESTTGSSTTVGSSATVKLSTIGKVVSKNASEYYVLLQDSQGKSSYYSFKATSPITDATGAAVPVTKLTAGTSVEATIQLEGTTEYITSIKVVGAGTTSTPTTPEQSTTPGITNTVSGILSTNISNDIVRVTLTDGTSKPYLVDAKCAVTLNGVAAASTDALKAGDTVTVTLVNNVATRIVATSVPTTGSSTNTSASTSTTVSSNMTSGEITAKKFAGNNYVLTLMEGNTGGQVVVPVTATITRNGKKADLTTIRIGDKVKLTKENGIITAVEATGVRTTVDATIKGIYIAATSKLVVIENNEEKTYTIGNDVEIYDDNVRDYINFRNLHLGQEITIALESKEIISIDVERNNSTYNLMGTITDIGKGDGYIDVLVDYDYVTGESKVYKRVETPSDLKVIINGKTYDRRELEEDMSIVINYKYLDDSVPEKILVL